MKTIINSTTHLGSNISSFRKEKGWTQEELAFYLNVSPRSIRAWEGGETIPKTLHLIEIANTLSIEIGRLFH